MTKLKQLTKQAYHADQTLADELMEAAQELAKVAKNKQRRKQS